MSFRKNARRCARERSGLCVLALALLATLITGGCQQPEQADEIGFPSTDLAAGGRVSTAPALIFVKGGRLRMLQPDGTLRTLSERGSEQVPVGVFDVSASSDEAVLAHGGSVGVVRVREQAGSSGGSTDEEWYDLRALAGEDFYVSLVGFVPPGRRILAGGYGASKLEEGFQLLSVDRDTGKAALVVVPVEQKRLVLRDLRFSPGGSAYLHLVDETVPSDYVYRIVDGELKLVFDTKKLLGKGTGEGYEDAAGGFGAIVSLSLVDLMALGEDLYLVVYILSDNGEDSGGNLTERCEIWRFGRDSLTIEKRYDLANPHPDELMDMYFAMTQDGIYFARLGLIDEFSESQPVGFSIVRLNIESGEVAELCDRELPNEFYSLDIFPAANACAVIYGPEGQLRVDGISLAGEKLQTGISIERPDVRYLPSG